MIKAKNNVIKLEPYKCARDLYKEGIFMDANEYPEQWVQIDWVKVSELNRYPDSSCEKLKEKLCEKYLDNIRPEQVFVGAGSDEIIDLLIRGFVEYDESILVMNPSYTIYKVQASINSISVKEINLNQDFSVNVSGINDFLEEVKIIFLCSPNNPTGNLVTRNELMKIMEIYDGLVVLDEAYIEFAGLENSLVDLVNEYKNLVVLRTFSKAWGLAGIRVGYSISSSEIVDTLLKIKDSYNVSKLSQEIAIQALDQTIALNSRVNELLRRKEDFEANLKSIGIMVIPTVANFTLIKVENPKELFQEVCNKGVIIRDRSNQYLLDGVIRISIGTEEENKKLLNIIK